MRRLPPPLPDALRACVRCGVRPGLFFLTVKTDDQTTTLYKRCADGYAAVKTFRCSTSKFGIGEKAGSYRTPRGLHRIAQKIGGGWPPGAVFKERRFIGYTWRGLPLATITHRILWLEGLEAGFNRGGEVDTFRRFIYIHGAGDELRLGRPDSHGCIQLAANDLIPLYDVVPVGTLVWLAAPSRSSF